LRRIFIQNFFTRVILTR